MTRYYYDSEFVENGKTIDLISIGIVCEDGREYYAQSVEFDHRKANPWVRENVLPQLLMCPWAHSGPEGISGLYRTDKAYHRRCGGQCIDQQRGWIRTCPWRTRKQIKQDILSFMDIAAYGTPELWADYASYDHVAFCQLFGTMMDLPAGFPMYTHDLQQWADALGVRDLPEQELGMHHALSDARWDRHIWQLLHEQEQGGK